MTQPPAPEPPLNEKLAEWGLRLIMAGGVAGGGAGALVSLFRDEDILKAVLAFGFGVAISYGAKLLMPVHRGTQRRLEETGEAFERRIDRLSTAAIARITNLEDRYRACQAADCETYQVEGVGKISGIFTPLLEQVFVPLELDRSALVPGFCGDVERAGATAMARDQDWLATSTVTIWQLLARAHRNPVYSQIAILAWGGYGKTTLLRHVAYTLGSRKQPQNVRPYLPVLLLLRKYRDLLSGEAPPNLPKLIVQNHLPGLPVSAGVQMSEEWIKAQLDRGQVVVMLDGFDEVPRPQRPGVARWLNQQMGAYRHSVFILTARPKAYTEQTGADRLDLNTLLWVRDLNPDQRRDFVHKWYWCQEYYAHGLQELPAVQQVATRSAEDLLRQVEQRPELGDLAKNPLLLNMIATFHRRYPSAALPRRRVELYQEMCTLLLRDRPGARAIETCLEDCDAQGILQSLALDMMVVRAERLDLRDLRDRLTHYLGQQEESVNPQTFLEEVERISELLVQREPEEYEFAHLSFQEFLAAKEIVQTHQENLLYDHLEEDWWKQVILFYGGMIKPSGFIRALLDRGATDLAYQCWQETRRRLDADLQKDLEELAALREAETAVQVSRYSQLEAYLKAGEWRKADKETYRLMITTVGKEEGNYFTREELLNFPCEELLAIDGLWVRYSGGKFGFSVQKKIWQECGSPMSTGKDWDKFCVRVGWQDSGATRYLSHSDLKADPKYSPTGEFPWFGERRGGVVFLGGGCFFSRTETCKL